MKQINLLTFATSNWKESPKRIQRQTQSIQQQTNIFQNIFIYNENDLSWEWHQKFDKYSSDRGYALWAWKPAIILQALKQLKIGDRLIYIDGGCQLPENNAKNFSLKCDELFNEIEKTELNIGIGYFYNQADRMNIRIIRKQILEKFDLLNDNYFLYDYPHFEAGALMFIKTESTMKFIESWYRFIYDNYENAIRSDFYDKSGQYPEYMHNGSDQAVMQCMLYNYNKTHDAHFDIGTFFYNFNIYTRIRG